MNSEGFNKAAAWGAAMLAEIDRDTVTPPPLTPSQDRTIEFLGNVLVRYVDPAKREAFLKTLRENAGRELQLHTFRERERCANIAAVEEADKMHEDSAAKEVGAKKSPCDPATFEIRPGTFVAREQGGGLRRVVREREHDEK